MKQIKLNKMQNKSKNIVELNKNNKNKEILGKEINIKKN